MPAQPKPVDPAERATLVSDLTVAGRRTAVEAAFLVDALLGKPDPSIPWHTIDAGSVRRRIDDGLLLDASSRFGWVRRDGSWLGCGHATHSLLLHCFGMFESEAERAGWARVGPHGTRCLFRLDPRQRRAVVAKGHRVDDADERMKPRMGEGAPLADYAERAWDDPESRGFRRR